MNNLINHNYSTNCRVPSPGTGLLILFLGLILGIAISSVLVPLLLKVIERPEAALRIAAVIQDILVFVIPAALAAVFSTRLPAKLLAVDVTPQFITVIIAIATLIVAAPALNAVIEWNQNIHLPESMSEIEKIFRQMEDAATETTNIMMGANTIGTFIVSILIVGVLAGFCEELFFRGALQRLLMATRMGPHICIWITAFIFSAFHFQFFGFVPRLILGAYFGYLLWWSRSLWVPIIVHMVNNSIVVISQWHADLNGTENNIIDNVGKDLSQTSDIVLVIFSIALTIAGLYFLRRFLAEDKHTATVG